MQNINRKEAIRDIAVLTLSPVIPKFMKNIPYKKKTNIIMILCDQFRTDACKREGFALDTTPFIDSLALDGTWFDKAYCGAPACVPSRTAMLTGRFPSATMVRSNWNIQDAVYEKDIVDVVKSKGYLVGGVGKLGHSFLRSRTDRFDFYRPYTHLGQNNTGDASIEKFNRYLHSTNFYADFDPAPFPPEMEQPYRIISGGIEWISEVASSDSPFFLYISIPEPHNPYQVPEPYYSMFPPESLPPVLADKSTLKLKGKKYTMQHELEEMGYPGFEEKIPRIRSNYYGMLRLIDDQIKRLVTSMEEKGIYEETILLFVADHGDYVGQYGLIKKGAGASDCLTRIPMIWHGPGIVKDERPNKAHVSNIDILPTICGIVGAKIPDGVIGRNLWPVLKRQDYPEEEFSSVIGQQGFGGRDYTEINQLDPYEEGCLSRGKVEFDELNSYSQSGILRFLRKGDWKLIYNMQGNGRLYNLISDPGEVIDLFHDEQYKDKKLELIQDMLAWELRSQDPLPLPRARYVYRGDKNNYWTPYKDSNVL